MPAFVSDFIATVPTLSGSTFRVLTPGNPKTVKGMKKGFWTFILHLLPADLSGRNVCANATPGCKAACLNTAGRGGILKPGEITNSIQLARLRRTERWFDDRTAFIADLVRDIRKARAIAERHGFVPVFRLNGTSDIRWELASFEGRKLIGDVFADLQFYDYTKLTNRRGVPSNYHLTFSAADGNDADVLAAIAQGLNVAVVFRDKATVARYVASGYAGRPVFVGDESDLRFTDPAGICALYAKGKARHDTSGFVRD
jgi:hypothetical protein